MSWDTSSHTRKWYEPRHLPETYWRPWYSGATSYTRQPYSRYVNRLLEGDDFYDVFGQPIGRGWLVYTWTQSQPQASGSQLFKRPPEDPRTARAPSQQRQRLRALFRPAGYHRRPARLDVVSADGRRRHLHALYAAHVFKARQRARLDR